MFAAGGDYDLLGLNAFLKFGGTLTRMQNLGKGFVGVFRTQGQGKAADPNPLPPSQQFQIGGLSSVRGYPEATLINDDGYAMSAEVDTPVPFSRLKISGVPLGQHFRTAWFVDHGGIVAERHTTYLTGTGGGLLLNLSRYLQGRVIWQHRSKAARNLRVWQFILHLKRILHSRPFSRCCGQVASKAERLCGCRRKDGRKLLSAAFRRECSSGLTPTRRHRLLW